MSVWLEILVAVAALVCPLIAGYFGVQRGMAVGLAVHQERLRALEHEVVNLRHAKHDIAQRVTEHEAWLHVIKNKLGMGS